MFGMFATENPAPQKHCGRAAQSDWLWGCIPEARLKSWPIAIARLEMSANKVDPRLSINCYYRKICEAPLNQRENYEGSPKPPSCLRDPQASGLVSAD